jgi:PAS domain S-box-containing protein
MISVLYVDDEIMLLDICKVFLERSGELHVEVTPSATHALDLITSKKFDAVVSDYQMLEMDGIVLLKEVRSRNPDLPFIIFTGKGREEVVIEAINNGADFYLQKGGDPKSQFVELEHKIKQAVRRRRAETALQESEQRFRRIAERSSDLVMIIDEHYVPVYVSPSVQTILGFSTDEIIGHRYDEIVVSPEDVGKIERALSRNREGIPTEKVSFGITRKNGSAALLEAQGIPIIEEGKFRGVQIEMHDVTERIRAERALKESESRYRTMFESTGTAMIIIEEDTTVSLANTEFLRLTGYSREDFNSGKSWTEFVAKEDLERLLAQHRLRREWREDAFRQYEFRLITKTGEIRDMLVTIDMIPNTKQSIASLIDITEQKKAEAELKNRSERALRYQKIMVNLATTDAPTLRDAMNRITETGATTLGVERTSIWFFSSDGRELVCNDVYLPGRNAHESGQTLQGADYPRYFAALQDNRMIVAANARTDENTREFTAGYLGPLGITSMLIVPIRSGRHVVGVLCFEHTGTLRSWDVEEQDFAASLADFIVIVLEKARRRLAEKDLRKSENRSRITQFAVEHAAEGILWFDGDGRVVYANAACCMMLGYNRLEIAGITIFDIDTSVSQVLWKDYLTSKVASDSLTFETTYSRKRGERFPVEVTSDYFEYKGTIYVCSFIRDISDRKRSEKALMLANEKLNLLSSVTRHDILNKLTAVLGYLELAKMVHDRDRLEDFISKINEMIQIIQDQIQFTRDYQDLGVKAPEWQDIQGLFVKAVSQLDLSNVRLDSDLSGLRIYADPLLVRVVYNIIDNALRYGEHVTIIRTFYRYDGADLVWVIEDNGVGISAKDKSMIFNKGFGKHTGLGLFLAREILAITGLTIMETGFPGKGARFEIIVPPGAFQVTKKIQ